MPSIVRRCSWWSVVAAVVLTLSGCVTRGIDPLYDERNNTGSCFGYPNVTEQHNFFAAMVEHVTNAQLGGGGGGGRGMNGDQQRLPSSATSAGLAKYPIRIGTTQEGRPLEAMCLGYRCAVVADDAGLSGAAAGEPSDADIPQSLFTGLHHAREPTSLGVLYYFVRDLVQKYVAGDAATRLLLHSRQLWFIPVVNPDGYAANCRNVQGHMVRTNMRPACTRTHGNRGPGVDLNRNYPICFERAKQVRKCGKLWCGSGCWRVCARLFCDIAWCCCCVAGRCVCV